VVAPIRRALGDCEAQLWLSAPRWADRPTAAVGRVVGEDVQALAALLDGIAEESAGAGAEWLLGPLDGDTWHSYRLATTGSTRPPFALEPPSAPAVEAALSQAGFAPVLLYESSYAPLSGRRIPRLGSQRLRVRPFDTSMAEAELARMHQLALVAFAQAPLFTPIGYDAFAALYRPALAQVVPELVLFAEDEIGTPVGFLFGLPDWVEGPRPRAAILKTYAAVEPGAGALLAGAFHDSARRLGFEGVIHALMHADNGSLRHSRLLGGAPFRYYSLFARRLA